MQVPWANILMMCSGVMLALIISKILLARVPFDVICILGNLVADIEISHLHQTQLFAFDRIINYANGSSVVAMHLRFGLQVAKFLQSMMEYHAFFAI
jgi:hypothetical protein